MTWKGGKIYFFQPNPLVGKVRYLLGASIFCSPKLDFNLLNHFDLLNKIRYKFLDFFFHKTQSLHNFSHSIVTIGLSSGHKCIKIISGRTDFILDQCAVGSTVITISNYFT